MTIAACYLSTEGVVFGADSTTTLTMSMPGQPSITRHYDFAQKIFQVGEVSTLGVVTWGMGNLPDRSYRTLIAQFADLLLKSDPFPDMAAVAQQWSEFFWKLYSPLVSAISPRLLDLLAIQTPTEEERNELFGQLQTYTVGFCFGGNLVHDRTPRAFEVIFAPDQITTPTPRELRAGCMSYWGCPNLMERLVYGIDPAVFEGVLASGKWQGSQQDLLAIVQPSSLQTISLLPIREAIDWIHASVYATIKMMRYSHLEPICGGPVEVAVITADRPFRWVRHKSLDVAITVTDG